MFGTKHKLPLIKDIRITIRQSIMRSSSHVRNLGVVFDSSLSMTNHTNAICRTSYMHLHNISRIRRYLTKYATKSLMHTFVISGLDYGNALLTGLPLEQMNKLQRIQNMAARIIPLATYQASNRIQNPSACVRCLDGTAPLYFVNMLKRRCSTRRTCSSQQHLLEVPRTKLVSFGDRSDQVIGSRL